MSFRALSFAEDSSYDHPSRNVSALESMNANRPSSVAWCLVAFLAVGARAYIKDRCPFAVGKFPFDNEKFAGTWYVVSCTGNAEEMKSYKCPKYELVSYKSTAGENGYDVKFSSIGKDSEVKYCEGFSRTYKDDKPASFLGVWRTDPHSEQYDGVYKQTLLATDYDNYAVFLACKPVFNNSTKTFGRKIVSSVLSRKTTLDLQIRDTLLNMVSGYDVDVSNAFHIEHADCAA